MAKHNQWSNVSAQKCKAIWDICSKLYKALGNLPDGKTPDALLKTTVGEMIDFGYEVVTDETIWAKLPKNKKTRQLRKSLHSVIDDCR